MRRAATLAARLPHIRSIACALIALAAFACRTTRPANEQPLAPGTPLAGVHAVRSFMRIRAASGERTQSFKAQLLFEPAAARMRLDAYTPIGTAAMTLLADCDRVTFLNHLDRTAWQGSAAELSGSLDLFAGAAPSQWALAVLGYPSALPGVEVSYDPPSPPPVQHATLRRGADRIDVTNLEVTSTDASIEAAAIPAGYRCCVKPSFGAN